MESTKNTLKHAVHVTLGDVASAIFLARVDKTFDAAEGDLSSLEDACTKVVKMVGLFIGMEEADSVSKRLDDIMKGL